MSDLQPVPFSGVTLTSPFWRERLEVVLSATIPSQWEKLRENGILDSLALPQPVPPLRIPRGRHNFTTQIFWDSDVGKWIEAASYALAHRRDEAIEAKIEAIVDDLEKAQAPDGYLNCWYLGREPDKRLTNLRDNHEFYNLGHLLEGAIAYFRATGRRRLLDQLERYIALIRQDFGTGAGQRPGYDGHQEIELALVKLYHLTGARKHLDLAAYFIDQRGTQPHYFDAEARARGEDPKAFWAGTYEYNQSHLPVRDQTKVVGHAVRAMYMYTAMADLARELQDANLRKACETLWRDVIATKMYVTSGLGPEAANEGFTRDYDLPNASAYAETCASVALVFWAQRMLHFDLDGRYADVLERALFNGALTGLARDGRHYFYANPLESDGSHRRWAWHHCPCCTMNASRLIGSVGGYFLSHDAANVALHLYGGVTAEVMLAGGQVRLTETSDYPWDGDIRIAVDPAAPLRFALKLRVPGWAAGAGAAVNGQPVAAAPVAGYLTIDRDWTAGDVVDLTLPMAPVRIFAHPAVAADTGRVALARGPLVYCLEEPDNAGGPVQDLQLPPLALLAAEPRDGTLGRHVAVTASGTRLACPPDHPLYSPLRAPARPATLTAIPYYLWGNREPGSMQVWIREPAG
jgi:DUF1680 family protein